MAKKIALVTGGVRGIGAAITRELIKSQQYFVIAFGTNTERCQKFVAEEKAKGLADLDAINCDVTDFAACQKTIAEIFAKYKRIDVLVNNAGITRDKTLKKMTKEEWDAVIKTDLDSLFTMTKPVLEIMLEAQYGRIINISSVNGHKGGFGQTNYAAAKSAIYGFTKSLALETARKKITVNSISPGYIETDMMRDIPKDIMDKVLAEIPVGRIGTAEEVARLVAFLADEASGYITGADFDINGGLYLR